MKKHVLATGTGSSDADKLADWMTKVMGHHQIATHGLPAFTYATLDTLLQ
jgi:hypothetical protein